MNLAGSIDWKPFCFCLSLFFRLQFNPSGIAAYVKALRPEIKVIGVEADDAAGDLQ